jgi:thiol-disulfide isomerase/thioredoxin
LANDKQTVQHIPSVPNEPKSEEKVAVKTGEVVEVRTLTELHEMTNAFDKVVVDFQAPAWCVPCKRLHPHFKAAAKKSDAAFVSVDIDIADEALKNTFEIMSVPTVLLIERGKETREIKGRTSVQILKEIEG